MASIDHLDSTYRTQAAFGSTLVNRSLVGAPFILTKDMIASLNIQKVVHVLTDED